MSHLKKDRDTGHLLKAASGHLVNGCEGNACNACDPPLPDIMFVTLANLGGAFAWANGKTLVYWSHDCHWIDDGVNTAIILDWSVPLSRWVVTVWDVGIDCWIKFGGPATACDSRGNYTLLSCNDTLCAGSCAASAAATCVVTYV